MWVDDRKQRKATGVPDDIGFQTKPEIALEQIRTAVDRGIPHAPVLADAAYGNDSKFREAIRELDLLYVLGVQSSMSVWKPGTGPLPKSAWKRNRTSAETSATQSAPCSTLREGVGLLFAAASVENGNLAGRNSTSFAFRFAGCTGSSRAP